MDVDVNSNASHTSQVDEFKLIEETCTEADKTLEASQTNTLDGLSIVVLEFQSHNSHWADSPVSS